ncbi:MAG TPA: hypothetical protein VIS48_01380 [Candidatus Kryptonia bacterium]
MNSRISSVLLSIAAVFVSFACTKTVPLGPVYTGEDDWTPSFTIGYNNYQRISGSFSKVPRASLVNNFDSCVVQIKPAIEDTFSIVVTAENPTTYGGGGFWTGPVLQMGATYAVRIAIYYKDGVVRYSTDTTIVSPVVPGKVLKEILTPAGTYPIAFSFSRRGILLCDGSFSMWMIDTSNGNTSLVSSGPVLPSASQYSYYMTSVTISGDTVYFGSEQISVGQPFPLLRYDPFNGWLDSSLVFGTAEFTLQGIIASHERIRLTWFNSGVGDIFREFDIHSGTLLNSGYSFYTYPSSYNSCYVDTSVWTISTNGNSAIGRVDSSGELLDIKIIPVYAPVGLAWDGANFWVWDAERKALVKLQLEGQ